jgi:diguanylate cyclase (GGDEF)-like protein
MQQPTRILYVEDDEDVRALTRAVLARDGFDVRAYASGEALLEAACCEPGDLLLLDVRLPGIGGAEALRRLRQRADLRAVPVVFVTGSSDPEELAALRAAGADEVISKPFDIAALGARLRGVLERAGGARPASRCGDGSLADRVRRIELALDASRLTAEARARLVREVHALATAADSAADPELAAAAGALESQLYGLYALDATDADIRRAVRRALVGLELRVDGAVLRPCAEPAGPDPARTLALVTRDDALAASVQRQLGGVGFEVDVLPMCRSLALGARPALAVLVDGQNDTRPCRELLADARFPAFVLAGQDDWPSRLAAYRAGARGFVHWPADSTVLLDTLDRLQAEVPAEPFRVLLLDDDDELLEHCSAVLRRAGFEVRTLSAATALLETLAEFRPELLLLDLRLADCSGIEVAGVIRQTHGHEGLPIVFLSGENRLSEQLAALQVGGDDFLVKPITDDHLVAVVTIRAQRFRALNALMMRDGLTGLLNHVTMRQHLEELLALSVRRGTQLSFALLDVDRFKRVNDRFGHPAGDRVLRTLARALARGLRRSDIVGRYGGEEFAVIMPDTTPEDARDVLDGLRQRCGAIDHAHEGRTFRVSFSGGVAGAGSAQRIDALIRSADAALYRAKAAGRDRIEVASALPA